MKRKFSNSRPGLINFSTINRIFADALKLYLLSYIDPVWQRLAENYFGETQDNYIQKLEQFYEHLNQLQDNNRSERNGRLLNNIPTLEMTYPSSIYADNIVFKASLKLSSSNKDCCSFQTINFLLKFLRGGNHNNESATTLLLAYLQMMKDHPKYYDGFMNPGSLIRLRFSHIIINI